MLVVLGLSVSLASQLTRDQVIALTAGSIGASGGLAIGYGLGRRRNG
jgi:Na+/glutamate symporter